MGKYDHGEIWSLVCELSKVCDTPVPDLFKAYGEYLFSGGEPSRGGRGHDSAFDVLQALDDVIHGQVRGLYPDAELPRFDVIERTANRMVLIYSSKRHFADLAEGLIRGCAATSNENAHHTRTAVDRRRQPRALHTGPAMSAPNSPLATGPSPTKWKSSCAA